jgi:hypothetical protein
MASARLRERIVMFRLPEAARRGGVDTMQADPYIARVARWAACSQTLF